MTPALSARRRGSLRTWHRHPTRTWTRDADVDTLAGSPSPLHAPLPHLGSSVTLDSVGGGALAELWTCWAWDWDGALCAHSKGPCSALDFNLLVSRAD